MKTSLMLIALLGLLAGCATKPPPPTATIYDPITGERRDVSENLLPSPANPPREVVYLATFRENKSHGSESTYYVQVRYIASSEVGYLEIPPGQTLTILADDSPVKLDGTGSMNLRKTFKQEEIDFVSESAIYRISRADLQKLGYARKIKVQIKGNKGLIDRDFTQENYDNLRSFVTRAAL
jgi:hypothetical protein